jgi:hypothetical protein
MKPRVPRNQRGLLYRSRNGSQGDPRKHHHHNLWAFPSSFNNLTSVRMSSSKKKERGMYVFMLRIVRMPRPVYVYDFSSPQGVTEGELNCVFRYADVCSRGPSSIDDQRVVYRCIYTLFWTINSWLMVWRALDCENRLTLVTLAFGYCPAFLALLSAGSIGWPTLYGPYKHTFSKSFSLILIHSSLNTRYNSKWRSRNTLFWPSNLVELLTWTHTKGREHHTSKLIKTETVKL